MFLKLLVPVGTQDISPLFWAILAGAPESSETMTKDILTIRADRGKFFCGTDELLHRHPDIVQIFLWRRSDFTTIGMRAGTTPCSTCLSTRAAAS